MKQKFSPFNFLVGIFTFGAISFATAQEPDCNQGDDTNNFESGYTINSTSMYSAADDFFVSPGNTLHVKSIELEIHSLQVSDPVDSLDFYFYNDDDGSPGDTVVETVTGVIPYAQTPIGSGGGFNIFSVMVEVDIEFEGGSSGAAFWMNPVADAAQTLYWGTTTIGTLGEPIHTRRENDPWAPDSGGEQAVFKIYCEVMTPPDPVCMFDIAVDILPITRIQFAGIDNESSPEVNGTPYLEDFTDIEGEVTRGQEYTFALEGNTNGNYTHFSSVWIDWNQNGEYEEDEIYVIGPLSDSTGEDGKTATIVIEVPEDAELGTTTFRVAKIWDVIPYNPCGSYLYGQGEEYSLKVEDELGISDVSASVLSYYPNPVENVLYINSDLELKTVAVYTTLGQKVMEIGNPEEKTIDLSQLSKGIYMVSAQLENGNSETFKIIKN